MNEAQFKARTKDLALRVIRMVGVIPKNQMESQIICRQLLRLATSVGASDFRLGIKDFRFISSIKGRLAIVDLSLWRSLESNLKSLISNLKLWAACRAKSTADMISKLSIVLEEADETLYWMELLVESGLVPASKLKNLMDETNEIVSMLVASLKTLRSKSKQSRIYNSAQS